MNIVLDSMQPFKSVAALRAQGLRHPWRILWSVFKSRYLPHSAYLVSDRDGYVYNPHILQWSFWGWMLWRNQREIDRQRADGSAKQWSDYGTPTMRHLWH